MMETQEEFKIEIDWDGKPLWFNVKDYIHHDGRCKFEVYKDNEPVASFEPDKRGYLHLCKTTGDISEEALHLIADKIESQHWW